MSLLCTFQTSLALDLSFAFTNVSSIEEINADKLKVRFRCENTTSGIMTLFESTSKAESKACAQWEQKAWYKAREYCEKRNLYLMEISRETKNSPSNTTLCYGDGYCSSRSFGDNVDTDIYFTCLTEPLVDKSIEDAQARIKEEHEFLQINTNSSKGNQNPIASKSKDLINNSNISNLTRLVCIGKERDLIEIGDDNARLFNSSTLVKKQMLYDKKTRTLKSYDSKIFRFNSIKTKSLKFSDDISQTSFVINKLVIYDDNDIKINTQCSFD